VIRNTTPGVPMGRPPKCAEEARSSRVVMFVTERDHAELKVLAERHRLSLSALCNELIVNALNDGRND